MATFRIAARFRPVSLVKTIPGIGGSNKGSARSLLLIRCSPAFHRLLKEAHTIRTSFATSCKSYTTTTTTYTEVTEPDVLPPTTIDELISSPNVNLVESCLKQWIGLIGYLKGSGKKFKLTDLTLRTLDDVVKFSLKPTSAPELRYKCLIVLLTQNDDLEAIEPLLNQTVSEVMSLPLKVLTDIVSILSESKKTPLRDSARKDLVLSIVNSRWYELGPKNIVFYMYQLDDLFDMKKMCSQNRKLKKSATSPKTKSSQSETLDKTASSNVDSPAVVMSNLEAKLIAVANEIKIKDLSRVVLLLGKWLNRNEPLLNAVLHRLTQDDLTDFTYIQLYNVLFACSVLRLYNNEFFQNVFTRLGNLQPPSIASACGVLSSMSFLRYRDVDVILATLDFLSGKTDSMTTRQANNVVTSLSNLYPVPFEEHHAQLVLDMCQKVFTADPKDPEEISVVYSLAVLLLLSGEMADSTLNPDLVRRVNDSKDSAKFSMLQRVAQINMAARHEVKEYKGSLLSDEELKEATQVQSSPEVDRLTSALLKAISRFADLSTYVRTAEVLPPGLNVTAVMCANKQGGVLPLSLLDNQDKEPLHRLALMVVPYAQVTSPKQIPVGSQQMKARLLRHLGYTPVHILYSDLRSSNSPAETVNNIKHKISAAVQQL